MQCYYLSRRHSRGFYNFGMLCKEIWFLHECAANILSKSALFNEDPFFKRSKPTGRLNVFFFRSFFGCIICCPLRSPFDFLRRTRDTITASGAQPLDSDRLAGEGAAHISGACEIPLICLLA